MFLTNLQRDVEVRNSLIMKRLRLLGISQKRKRNHQVVKHRDKVSCSFGNVTQSLNDLEMEWEVLEPGDKFESSNTDLDEGVDEETEL